MIKFSRIRSIIVAGFFLVATLVSARAQTNFTILKALSNTNGVGPWGPVTLGNDGFLYGSTIGGSFSSAGTIFRVGTNGTGFSVLYYMANTTASNAYGGVVFGTNGALYGTTYAGGVSNGGTVFRINKDGTGFTILHSFLGGADGLNPMVGLIRGSDGFLYGTTSFSESATRGTIFKIDGNGGNYFVMHQFTGPPDGGTCNARLTESSNGMLYGTTTFGGASSQQGCVFSIDKSGNNYNVLYRFQGIGGDGGSPQAGVTEASDGFLYGTTYHGGTGGNGTVYKLAKDLSFYSVLYRFTATNGDGKWPNTDFVEGGDGTIYGITENGGLNGNGTVYKIDRDGNNYTILRRFSGMGTGDGSFPKSGLIKDSNGIFYGTTVFGGGIGSGGIFAISSNALPPRIVSLVQSNSSNIIQFSGTSGVQYDVLRSTNLASSNWTNLGTLAASTNCLFTNVDLSPPAKAAFYRLQQH